MSGAAGSYFVVRELERRAVNAHALCRLLRECSEQVEYFSRSAADILSNCDISLLQDCGYYANKAPDSFLELFESCEILCPKSRAIVLEFARDFGKNYREEQIKRCRYYLERMSTQESELNSALPTQKKLAFSLLLSLTLIAVILLV